MNTKFILIIRAVYTGLFTGIVIAIPMGPAGFESVRWTITKGYKQGIKVAAGSLIADAIDVMLINFGLLELIEKSKLLEVIFWIISGIIIFYLGCRSFEKNISDKEVQMFKGKKKNSTAVFTGFIVNFSNPMTHFFWLTLSSTVIRIWRSFGKFVYFIFALFMLSGMFISLFVINFLAFRGKSFTAPKISGKFENLLSYVILAFGTGFIINGLYKLFIYIFR